MSGPKQHFIPKHFLKDLPSRMVLTNFGNIGVVYQGLFTIIGLQ